MYDQIRRLKASDYEELVRLLNEAFGYPCDHGFDRLSPVFCRPDDEAMQCHHAICRNRRIVAVVGVYPLTWRLDGKTLCMAGIGNVAVDAAHRGKGLMHQLMVHASQEVRSGGYHLSYLGGQRQRYLKYGWEAAGMHVCVEINSVNSKSFATGACSDAITFDPLENAPLVIEQMKSMHDARRMWCPRETSDFTRRLRTWCGRPRVARNAQGRIIGYAVLDEDEAQAWEVVGQTDAVTLRMIQTLAAAYPVRSGLKLHLDIGNPTICREVLARCEYVTTTASGNWQVFDWPAVVGALLSLKHKMYDLPHGSVVLGVQDQAKVLLLEVDQKDAQCCVTDRSPDLAANATTITRLLLGPLSAEMCMDIPPGASILHSWCPLPLDLPQLDRV